MQRVVVPSAALEAASILREEILRDIKDDEWLLGSEDEVMRSLEVSRPTLRQALRLLEQEQLVSVRRGVGGGLFARRPTEEGVTHTASVYLRAAGTSYGDLIASLSVLSTHAARNAAENPDLEARQRLSDYYPQVLRDINATELPGEEFVVIAGRFYVLLGEVAKSPTLALFISVLIELARPAAGRSLYTAERIGQTVERHTLVAAAVLAGKSELAARRMRTHTQDVLHWTDESMRLESMYPGHRMSQRR